MSAELTIGLVGCGLHADAHVGALLACGDVIRATATCDLNGARAAMRAQQLGAEAAYQSYADLLANPRIDAVLLCLPHDQHASATVAAALAGKHILVEKPIARSLEEADAMIAAADDAGVVLMVGHNQRFDAQHRRVRELLDDGVIGSVYCGRADHNMEFLPPPSHWIMQREAAGGGAMIGYGIHRIDLLRWFIGEVTDVGHFQLVRPGPFEAETTSVTILQFGSEAVGEVTVNWQVQRAPWKDLLFLYGDRGTIHNAHGRLEVDGCGYRGTHGMRVVEVPHSDPFAEQLHHFATSVLEARTPLTSGDEARRSLAVCLAAYEAAEKRSIIRL